MELGKAQSDALTRQLAILQSQYEAQNKHPVLEARATSLIATPGQSGEWKAVLLQARSVSNLDVPLESNNNGTVDVDPRNVGDAPAVNVSLIATPSTAVTLRCIIPSARRVLYTLERPTPGGFDECSEPRRILSPIEPRPTGRHTVNSGYADPEFDIDYDANFRIELNVPKDIINFMLEIVVLSDRLSPAVYEVHCHAPSHGKSVNFH